MTSILWSAIWPEAGIDAPVDLYHRGGTVRPGSTVPPGGGGGLHVPPGVTADLDTYFNGFSVTTWRARTTVQSVTAVVEAEGRGRLHLVHRRHRSAAVVGVVDLPVAGRGAPEAREIVRFEPVELASLGDGRLHLEVVGGPGRGVTVHAQSFVTDTPPARPVELGIVVTTFNRPDELGANLVRLARHIAAGGLGAVAELVIVDNGRSLRSEVVPDGHPLAELVTVLPNPNTGGAGGFTRGLMHLRAGGRATHVLFMDDDVAFHPAIVDRTAALLGHARDPRLSIAGAMMADDDPGRCFENGARYEPARVYPVRARGHGVDLTDADALDALDRGGDGPIDYAAWWFHAFPIAITDHNPLPVFLRGDDVAWGLMHTGAHTIATTGIGLWHQSFELKNGPHAWFYDTRNYALLNALAVPGYRARQLLWRYLNLAGRSLLSFKYASAEHITAGVEAFLAGPRAWLDVDHPALDAEIRRFDGEHIGPLPAQWRNLPDTPAPSRPIRYGAALASLALLAGHVPCRRAPGDGPRRVATAPLQSRALGASLRHDAIVYRNVAGTHGFVAVRDDRRFYRDLGRMLWTAGRILARYRHTAAAYRRRYPELVSDGHWHRQLGTGRRSADRSARPEGPLVPGAVAPAGARGTSRESGYVTSPGG